MRVLGSYYFVRRLPSRTETDGGLTLPETAVEETHDYLVFGAGPGRTLDSGRPSPMQAQVGDRIIARKPHFTALDEDEREGFIADESLVAIVPGPEYAGIGPAGDYVMIQPDRTALESAGGILIAADSLPGGVTRMELRGEELRLELRRLQATPRFRELDALDKERAVHDFLDALSREELAAVREAFRREQAGIRTYERRPVQARKRVTTGTVLAVGPGAVQDDGTRRNALGAELSPGSAVRWSEEHRSVRCSNGEAAVLMIQAAYLLATSEEASWREEASSPASLPDPSSPPASPARAPDASPSLPDHRRSRLILPPGLHPSRAAAGPRPRPASSGARTP